MQIRLATNKAAMLMIAVRPIRKCAIADWTFEVKTVDRAVLDRMIGTINIYGKLQFNILAATDQQG